MAILSLLFSCSGVENKAEVISLKKETQRNFKAEFDRYFGAHYDSILSLKSNKTEFDSVSWLNTFYKYTKYKTVWINDSIQLSEKGIKLLDKFQNAKNYGLKSNYYAIKTLLKLKKNLDGSVTKQDGYFEASRLEILLTYYYMLCGKHLNYGVLRAIDSVTILPRKKFTIDLPSYLYEAFQKDSVIEKLLDLQPANPEYHNLQKGLELFLKEKNLSTNSIEVENFRIDSIQAINQAKKALISLQYLTENENDSIYFNALTKFQIEHGLRPDRLIGKNTAKALSISTYRYYRQIVANLERWRWKENWPKNYIYINIPSYKLKLFRDSKRVRERKIVVGNFKSQTPEIIDTLEYLIAYPYWNVPRKISIKEILGKVREDSTYLEKNNFEVLTYAKDSLDPSTINWNEIDEASFNYLIRQRGGSSNALGLVKFIFPNKHAIYLHDTPAKYLFNKETRAYSHGCIRVEKALDLADYLLKSDNNEYNLDSVYHYIKIRKEKSMLLNTKIPIYIYYITANADSLGRITFYNDVYNKDEKLISELAVKRD